MPDSLTIRDRQSLSLQCMQSCLNKFAAKCGEKLSASNLCGELMRHALLMSQGKRAVLEDPELYSDVTVFTAKAIETVQRSPFVKEMLASTRGKMDHASICAVTIQSAVSKSSLEEAKRKASKEDTISRDLPSFSRKTWKKNFKYKKRSSIASLP